MLSLTLLPAAQKNLQKNLQILRETPREACTRQRERETVLFTTAYLYAMLCHQDEQEESKGWRYL